MNKGLFISFEGGDGAGKSTQISLLTEYLQSLGYQVLLTREPGGTQISEKIRGILLDPENKEMEPVTEMMLYAAARAQLVRQVIRPALEEGKIVICDRFLDSSLAYQAWGRDLGDAVMDVNRYAVEDCMPDVTIYLRVDADTGRQRISGREMDSGKGKDRIESEPGQFHDRVHEGYEQLCRQYPDRIRAIDAGGRIEDIEQAIRLEVMNKINADTNGIRE